MDLMSNNLRVTLDAREAASGGLTSVAVRGRTLDWRVR